jgi:hypothetical protein
MMSYQEGRGAQERFLTTKEHKVTQRKPATDFLVSFGFLCAPSWLMFVGALVTARTQVDGAGHLWQALYTGLQASVRI